LLGVLDFVLNRAFLKSQGFDEDWFWQLDLLWWWLVVVQHHPETFRLWSPRQQAHSFENTAQQSFILSCVGARVVLFSLNMHCFRCRQLKLHLWSSPWRFRKTLSKVDPHGHQTSFIECHIHQTVSTQKSNTEQSNI